MSERRLDSASMEDFRNMAAALVAANARLAAVEARLDHWEGQIGEWYDHEDGPGPEAREGYDRGVTHLIAAIRDVLHPEPASAL